MSEVIHVTPDNLTEVLASDTPVLLDFWAPWCGPCKALNPTIDTLAKDVSGKAVIAKVNVDDNPEMAHQFNVRAVPTLVVCRNGQPVNQASGVMGLAELRNLLEV